MNINVYVFWTALLLMVIRALGATPLNSEIQSDNAELIRELIDRVKTLEVNDLEKSAKISELEAKVVHQAEELRIVKQRLNDKDQQIENLIRQHADKCSHVYDLETTESENTLAAKRHRRAATDQSTIVFSAGLTHTLFHEPVGENIAFDQVELNEGNGYDSKFGTFTAPVEGMYVLFASMLADNDGEVWAKLVVNGVTKGSIFARGSDGKRDQGSQLVIVHLNAGDIAAVQHRHSDNDIYRSGSIWSIFSGFILPTTHAK